MAATLASVQPNTEFLRQKTLSRTACSSCRSQKIRCSRDKPVCTRCVRRRLSCFYPDPPNRSRFTSARASSVSLTSRRSPFDETAHADRFLTDEDLAMVSSLAPKDPVIHATELASPVPSEAVPGHPNESTNSDCISTETCPLASPRQLRCKPPEFEIGLLLIEVFFSRVWTAALLFDHRTFIEDYRAAHVPEHVLLSVFALASLFFRAPLPGSCTKENGLAAFASIHAMGRAWAESGSQLVLTHADKPSVSNVQACEVLCFYWFAVGQLDRTAMHFSISRESCRLLQQKADRKEIHGRVLASDYSRVPQRLSWACSIKSSVMETDVVPANPSLSTSDLPLASFDDTEAEFTSGSSTPARSQKGVTDWLTWEETGRRSTTAYVVKLFRFWKEIKSFVQHSSYSNASAFLAAFFNTDSQLQQFYNSLPTQFREKGVMTKPNSERLQRNVYFIRSIYYLCVMYLHSSAVPALSCTKTGLLLSAEIVKLSARTVFSTARLFVEMSREYLATTPDFTKVPSFVGYCAFVAGSVQEVVMGFQVAGEGYEFSGDVEICMVVLKELMAYWPVLKCFRLIKESDLERRLHRSNPHFFSPSKPTVQQLLQSPRPLIVDERYPPTLAAFINASSNIPSETDASFILRQYNNPNAFRHGEQENEESSGEEKTMEDNAVEGLTPRNEGNNNSRKDDVHDADLHATSPSTVELSRNENHFQANQVDPTFTSTLSPFSNTINTTISPGFLGENFMDLNAPSENLWEFGDLFSDSWGELLLGPSSDHFE